MYCAVIEHWRMYVPLTVQNWPDQGTRFRERQSHGSLSYTVLVLMLVLYSHGIGYIHIRCVRRRNKSGMEGECQRVKNRSWSCVGVLGEYGVHDGESGSMYIWYV